MDYDFYFELEGEKVNYLLDRTNYQVFKEKSFQENPRVSTAIKLFFENGNVVHLPISCRQNKLMPLRPDFVKEEYLKYLDDNK